LGWLLGLPVLALVWGLAIKGERTHVIRDLEQRANSALARQDLTWAQARFDITEGRLEGAAYSENEKTLALDTVRAVWGVWSIRDRTALVEKAPNYKWGAAIDERNLHLSGYIPNENARRQVLQAARKQFPSYAVLDEMRPARGAPGEELWIDGINFGLRQLMQLKRGGRVDLNGTHLDISGEAESIAAYRTIKGDFTRRLPNGIRLARDDVKPPRVSPFTWQAVYAANQIQFEGHVPAGDAHDRIIDIAKETFPKAAIVDKMTAAGGAPEDWLKVISSVMREIASLEQAEVRVSDRKVAVTGVAVKELISERVASALKLGMPETYKLEHKITFREPTLPTISPFTTTIVSDGEKVSLTGFAPDEAGRQRLVDIARKYFPKHEIVDAVTYGNGAPAGWLSCAEAGVGGLSQLDKGRAELSDAILRLTGETTDEKLAASLPATIRAEANRACKETVTIDVLAPPEPVLKWQAVSLGNRLELTGEVIDSGTKEQLLADARRFFPKHEILDNMRINPGRSAKWGKVVRLGLEQLASLRSGLARLDGLVLTVDGIAPDTAVSTQVKSRVERGIATGYSGQAIIEVKSDAMIWSEQEAKRKSEAAEAEREAKKIDEAKRLASLKEVQRLAAEAAAKALAAAEERRSRDEQRAKAEAEAQARLRAETEAARRKAAEVAQRQTEAEEARRREMENNRTAANAEARKAAETRAAAAASCTEALNQTVSKGMITFDFGSDKIKPESTSTLDKLIATYRKCPGPQLEISGHTDSFGGEDANLRLSERRAQAVLDYFVGKGLPRDKFVVRGYGEKQPRAANTSANQRAKNRRIEFNVLAE